MRIVIIASIVAAAGLGGCAYKNPGFGDAVHQNLSAQIADPEARYARQLPPGSEGVRSAAGVVRYQKGQVIPPQTTATTTLGAGSTK